MSRLCKARTDLKNLKGIFLIGAFHFGILYLGKSVVTV